MSETVVVLGAGYAGAGAIRSLEASIGDEIDLRWISRTDHHLVLHESHRCIRDPDVAEKVTVPVSAIKSPSTSFREAEVTGVDTAERTVHLADGDAVSYDYLLVGIGSRTAFFGIQGLAEHAHTLKTLEDALGIHEAVVEAGEAADRTAPARVVVGGAGLSGIQVAGEIAAYRDEADVPLDIQLVEGLDEVLPGRDPSLQAALRKRLEARDVTIMTGEFVGEVDADTVYVGEDEELAYDVLIWTGGITGRAAAREMAVDQDERSHRLNAGQTFQTSDERVFAIGDAALVDQPGGDPAPPTAQAAWQAAEVVGENIARAIRGQPLTEWTYDDKGIVVSVGEAAVAHDVSVVPFVSTFGGLPAKLLKKAIAARWIKDVGGYRRALSAWPDM
jgi:NADH dehydrogenase